MKITEEVFLEAYEKYKNTVYSVIFNYVKSKDDADELQQEVFIKFYRADTEFDSDEHIKAWLIRVSINLCKNHFRSKKHESDGPLPEDIPYEQEMKDNSLLEIVLAMPEKYRIPIHLFYYEDYSIKQIADVMDMPEATVRIRLKRGREKLAKLLRKEDWL